MAAKPVPATPLKRVHARAKDVMPVLTAAVTIFGFIASMLEARHAGQDEALVATQTATATDQDGKPVTIVTVLQPTPAKLFFGTLGVVLRYLVGTLIGLTIVAMLVLTAIAGGDVWLAVILTALVLTALWLASIKYTRRYARKVR